MIDKEETTQVDETTQALLEEDARELEESLTIQGRGRTTRVKARDSRRDRATD
jgi:hypothetical protein